MKKKRQQVVAEIAAKLLDEGPPCSVCGASMIKQNPYGALQAFPNAFCPECVRYFYA